MTSTTRGHRPAPIPPLVALATLLILLAGPLATGSSNEGVQPVWRFLAGFLIAVLGLAGIALGAVLVGRRLEKRSRHSFVCLGEPDIEKCRTCGFVRGLGNDLICGKYDKKIRGDEPYEPREDGRIGD